MEAVGQTALARLRRPRPNDMIPIMMVFALDPRPTVTCILTCTQCGSLRPQPSRGERSPRATGRSLLQQWRPPNLGSRSNERYAAKLKHQQPPIVSSKEETSIWAFAPPTCNSGEGKAGGSDRS